MKLVDFSKRVYRKLFSNNLKLRKLVGWPIHRRFAKYKFRNRGYCCSCNQPTYFTAYNDWLRDFYLCDNCGSIPRERTLMFCLEKFFPEWQNLVIHESSPVLRGTSLRLANESKHYIATQFYPGITKGVIHNGFRNENLEELTFEDESIDLHITQDVFEHVFNPDKAFKEIARTLKPGGAHVFTTPMVNKTNKSFVTARLNPDGTIEHFLAQPEYHGNPVSSEGSLVTMHWGYDICDYIFQACGLFTQCVYIDALELGIRAEYIELLITRKPK